MNKLQKEIDDILQIDFPDDYYEELRSRMVKRLSNWHKSKVKKIHKPIVSNQRELLIAYHESRMPKTRESYSIYIEKCVDDFLGNLV